MFDKQKEACLLVDGNPAFLNYHNITSLNQDNVGTFSLFINKALKDKEFIKRSNSSNWNVISQESIQLPTPNLDEITEQSLISILMKRRSRRKFIKRSISINTLSMLLKYGLGVTGFYSESAEKEYCNLYAYPTAGALNSLRFIVIINNVTDLDKGIYLYSQSDHSLLLVKKGFNKNDYNHFTASISLTSNAAFSIHFFADPLLTIWKYQDRGYRFLNLECGHAAQNLQLLSEYINIGSVCSGGFLDKELPDYINTFNTSCKDWILLYEMYFGNIDNNVENRFK